MSTHKLIFLYKIFSVDVKKVETNNVMSILTLTKISFEYIAGLSLFNNLDLTLLNQEKWGLVGPNGIGKSTLAKLITGELLPTEGDVLRHGKIIHFSQLEIPLSISVDTYLDSLWQYISPEDRKTAIALQAGINFSLPCNTLSGGEWTRVRLLKCLMQSGDLIILDEPTHHLDRTGRDALLNFVKTIQRSLFIISHDRELLSHVHKIAELSSQGLCSFSGNYDFYEHARELERERLNHELIQAKKERKKKHEQQIEKIAKQNKRIRVAKKSSPKAGLPKIIINNLKQKSAATLGRVIIQSTEKTEVAVQKAYHAFAHLKIDPVIYADLKMPSVPTKKIIFEAMNFNFYFNQATLPLWKTPVHYTLQGANKLGISGNNGAGKTTFLRLLANDKNLAGKTEGILKLGTGISYAYLDQALNLLDPELTILENILSSSKENIISVRNVLAQFLFPGDCIDQKISTLSGGERLRAALAKLFLLPNVPSLLMLDEPTNYLDMANIKFLEKLLLNYTGACMIISHDVTFLQNIGVEKFLYL